MDFSKTLSIGWKLLSVTKNRPAAVVMVRELELLGGSIDGIFG
jgi:hypothetical protein